MTKQDIIKAAAKAAGVTQETAEAVITAAIEASANALINGEPVKIHRFGTFEPRERAARTTHNFATGEKMQTAAGRTVGFKPADYLKKGLNE